MVSELGSLLGGKCGAGDAATGAALHEAAATAADREASLEDESVSSIETDYEYALTDITDGWKVKLDCRLSLRSMD